MDSQSNLANILKRVHFDDQMFEEFNNMLPSNESDYAARCAVKPLLVKICPESGKEFLCCDFNSHLRSFRSPHSNSYIPAISGPVPSKSLRDIEVRANLLFKDYVNSFYQCGISSVYIKESSERSYAMCFAVKNSTDSGSTDVVHIIDLVYDGHHKILFKLLTNLLLKVTVKGCKLQESICKANDESLNRAEVVNQELTHMIRMIENMEGSLKKFSINFIQSKPVQICNACRFFTAEPARTRDEKMLKSVWGDQNKVESEENKLSG